MGWFSDSFKAITGDITDALKSGNPSDIYHALAEVPGSPEATLEAIIGSINGKYNWNPYGDQVSWGDVMGGGTRESQGTQQRKMGRAIGTAIGAYFLGGLVGEGSGGAAGGEAASGAEAGGIEGAMDGAAFGGGTSSMGSAADSYYGLTAADNAAIDNAVQQSMSQPWTGADQVAVDTAGQSGFTDPTTGLQYDSGGLGQGTSNQPDWWSNLKDTYSKGSNIAKLLNAVQAATQKNAVPVGTSGFGSPSISTGGGNGAASNSANESSMLLENPISQMVVSQSPQSAKQQEPQNYGLIDISPANTPFQLSGATWNQQLANALRNRNAY